MGPTESSVKTDLSSDMKVREAFIRRALAYDQCGMISFETLDSWTDKLFRAMDREPPKGYRKVSLDQALAADKELWTLVAESTSAGVAALPDGTQPVDDARGLVLAFAFAVRRVIDSIYWQPTPIRQPEHSGRTSN